MCVYIYIYLYREREREREMYIYIYIAYVYVYIYIYIDNYMLPPPYHLPPRSPGSCFGAWQAPTVA